AAGGVGRFGLLLAEPARAALRPRRGRTGGQGGDSLAVRKRAGDPEAGREPAAPHQGGRMTTDAVTGASVSPGPDVRLGRPRFAFDKRYLAPVLVTIVLLGGQLTFGFLESWSRTALAIATAMVLELAFGKAFLGKWPHLASAYV